MRSRLPLLWDGVSMHALGASRLRVRLSLSKGRGSSNGDGLSLVAVNENGALVAAVESLIIRTVSSRQLAGKDGGYEDQLFKMDWTPRAAGSLRG